MRWDRLFDDLEGQLAAAQAAERRADLADLIRAERAQVRLVDRVRAAIGSRLRVVVGDEERHPAMVVEGVVADAAVEWFVLDEDSGAQVLVPMAAVCAVRGLGAHVAPEAGLVESRLGLGHVLRALARDRVRVRAVTEAGVLVGRIDAVGADHLELTDGRSTTVLTFGSLRAVRSS